MPKQCGGASSCLGGGGGGGYFAGARTCLRFLTRLWLSAGVWGCTASQHHNVKSAYVCVRACMCVHACVRACVRARVRACARALQNPKSSPQTAINAVLMHAGGRIHARTHAHTHYCTPIIHTLIPHTYRALEKIQPRVVSFEESVTTIRENLAALQESEEEWSKAAQTLAGIDLDSGV